MSADFEAIVKLCRLALRRELQGATLRVWLLNSVEVDGLVTAAQAFRQPEIFLAGQQQHRSLSAIEEGAEIELKFDGLSSNSKVFSESLQTLVASQQGLFLYNAPPEYFLLEEDYATGDEVIPPLVGAYQRVPRLFELVRSVADVVLADGTSSPTFVILAGKRMDISAAYSFDALDDMPSGDAIDAVSVELQSQPYSDAKKAIYKKVLLRQLEATPQSKRFSELATRFDAIREAFASDFDLYTTEFNFAKVRDELEQKRLSFMLQLNASTTDLMGKMLAIPVGQGLIVSQLKNDPSAVISNIALLIGSLVFAAFAGLLIANQQHSLRQIKHEIDIESNTLKERFPLLHDRVSGMLSALRSRAKLHTYAFPIVVSLLAVLTTAYSVFAFMKVPPMTAPVTTAPAPRSIPAAPPAHPPLPPASAAPQKAIPPAYTGAKP